MQQKKYPKYLSDFLNTKYKISKRMKNSDILVKFGLDQNVIRDHLDTEPSKITNFKFKLGNRVVCKYTALISRPLDKCLNVNPVFHWEFLREVQMNEFSETETAFRHAQLVEEQRAKN
jgi:hypothetical protein